MEQNEIIEGNKLIAEFIADRIDSNSGKTWILDFNEGIWHNVNQEDWAFYTSWDWLMPVIDKIEALDEDFEVQIGRNLYVKELTYNCIIHTEGGAVHFESDFTGNRISGVWKLIVEFIQWYNNQK
jgi:hypothetical protein